MSRITWTPQAIEDVESIKTYIARDSEHYAALVVQRIVEAVDRLERFPESGRIVPEFHDQSLREVIWGSYRIVYRARGELVEVLTVFHGARQPRLL